MSEEVLIGVSEEIIDRVEQCEEIAVERFDDESIEEDSWFTSVTKWQDGDFRVEVRNGKGHSETEGFVSQHVESVIYRHEQERLVHVEYRRYAGQTRLPTVISLDLIEGGMAEGEEEKDFVDF